MSDSNLTYLAAQREASWGHLPTAPALTRVRFTKDSFEHTKDTVKSAEIRPDRQTSETVLTGVMAKGGFDFELSVGDFDDLLEAAFFGGWTKAGGTAASNVLTLAGNFADGEIVKIGGRPYTAQAALTAGDGNFVIGADAAHSILNLRAAIGGLAGLGVIYNAKPVGDQNVYVSAYDAATLTVTALYPGEPGNNIATTETSVNASWATATLTGGVGKVDTLSNGVRKLSYSLEKKLAPGSFVMHSGCMVDQLTLTVTSKQILTGQLTFVGKQGASAGATADSDATISEPVGGVILSSSANVGAITVNGVAVSSLKSLTLVLNNNLRGNDVIGSSAIDEVGIGGIQLTGKMEAYFRDLSLYQLFENHTYFAISFQVTREAPGAVSGDLIGYQFDLPNAVLPKGSAPVPGKDADVMLALEYEAHKQNGGTNATVTITKLFKA